MTIYTPRPDNYQERVAEKQARANFLYGRPDESNIVPKLLKKVRGGGVNSVRHKNFQIWQRKDARFKPK